MLNTWWQAGYQLSFTASPEGMREKGKVSCVCMNETVITHTIYVLYCTVVSVIEQLTSRFPLFSCQVWTLILQTVSVHTFLSSFTTPYFCFFWGNFSTRFVSLHIISRSAEKEGRKERGGKNKLHFFCLFFFKRDNCSVCKRKKKVITASQVTTFTSTLYQLPVLFAQIAPSSCK